MTEIDLVLVIMFVGVTLYALFGGADFGAGVWDLLAGGTVRGARTRQLIERVIGPVWEANHVWLIFVLVILWSCFPVAVGPIMSTLYIPLTGAAIGIIARGSGFAFRKAATTFEQKRFFGATFAFASLLTPFFLGTFAGGIASGRVPRSGSGDVIESWLNPTGLLGGTLAVLVCAYLAAVYLCRDARALGAEDIASGFRIRAMVTGVITGVVALAGISILRDDAERLYHGLTHEALWLVVLSGVGGVSSVGFLFLRRYVLARVSAGLAVTSVLWAWAVAQYPYIIENELLIRDAAGDSNTVRAVTLSLSIGSLIIIPAIVYLAFLMQRGTLAPVDEDEPLASEVREGT